MSLANEFRNYRLLDMIHLLRESESRGGHAAKHTIGDTKGTWAEQSMMTDEQYWGRSKKQKISDSTMFANPFQHSAYLSIEDHAEVLYFILKTSLVGNFVLQEMDKGAVIRLFGDLPTGINMKKIKKYHSKNWSYSHAYSHFLMLKLDGHKLVIYTSYPSDSSFDELRAALFVGHTGASVYLTSTIANETKHFYSQSWDERPVVITGCAPGDIKILGADFRSLSV